MILPADEFEAMMNGTDPQSVVATSAPEGEIMSAADFESAFGDSEDLPSYASGVSPEYALNMSPLSVEERAKLSVGNEAGKMSFLKDRFEDVKKTKSGDLVVKDNGNWKRVDADGWTGTKEALADIVDIAPDVVKAAVQIGAGTAAAFTTGGSSLIAQGGIAAGIGAALEAGEISLGRLFGTYEATPEEMAKDIAIEGLMNLGGTAVAAGIKPTGKLIAEGLKKGVEKVNQVMPVGAKESFVNMFASIGGVNPKAASVLFNNPDEVTKIMKEGYDQGGAGGIASYLTRENLKDIEGIARAARPALSNSYSKMSDEVVESLGDDFAVNMSASVKPLKDVLAGRGLGEFVTDANTGKESFKMFTKPDLLKRFQQTGQGSDFALDDASLAYVDDISQLINRVEKVADLKGKKGAKALLDIRKGLTDATYKLKEQADDSALRPAANLLAEIKTAFDSSIAKNFQLNTPVKTSFTSEPVDNLLLAMNSKYSELSNGIAPILKAVKQADKVGSDAAYQTLYNQISAKAGKSEVQKTGLENALNVINQYGGAAGSAANKMYKNIDLRDAAMSFAPFAKIGLGTQAPIQLATGMAATGNTQAATGVLASMIPTSPAAMRGVIKGAARLNKFYRGMSPDQVTQYLSNPEAVLSTMDTILKSPVVQQQAATELIRQGTGGR